MNEILVRRRHALGMREGSVRSILTLLVVALFCGVLWMPAKGAAVQPIPPYLLYLLFLILGHLFAAHSQTAADPAPLHLPRALIRLLIIVALAGTVGWLIYSDPERMEARWNASVDLIKVQWFLPLLLLGGFFVGVLLRLLVGHDNLPLPVQDFEAWLALIAVIGLCVAAMLHFVIEPSTTRPISHPTWESVLAAVVAFYFGARS